MKRIAVATLGFAESHLFAMKLWSLGTQVQKLKSFVAK